MLALSVGHCKIGQYLVRHGATGLNDCDMDGWTALLYASRDGHFSAVTYLIKKQVDINQCADYGSVVIFLINNATINTFMSLLMVTEIII